MKYRHKMTLCMLGLLSVLFGIGGGLLISISFQNSLDLEREAAYSAYQMALSTLQAVGVAGDGLSDKSAADTLSQLSSQRTSFWTAISLYTEDRTIYELTPSYLPKLETNIEAGSCEIRYHEENGRHFLTLYGALDAEGQVLYLNIARDISHVFETREAQTAIYRRVFLLLAAICLVLAYSLSGMLTRPLSKLGRASRAISAGNLSTRAGIKSNDEIGALARDFDAMADSLESNIAQLEAVSYTHLVQPDVQDLPGRN